jgi:spore coat polysaccharide biosynthesis protein SpsF
MKILAIIQARTGSTRLPNKVLLKISNKAVLEHVIERVKKSKFVTGILVATTTNKEDQKIVTLCNHIGIMVFQGSENDVLDRYYQAAKSIKPDHVVRITADCPLIDPKVIDDVVSMHLNKNADYTTNIMVETYPDGEDVEVFTLATLEKIWKNAKLKSEREHVTLYIRNKKRLFRIHNLKNTVNLSGYRWTLDNKEDYDLIKTIYKHLYSRNSCFGMKETVKFLNKKKGLNRINHHIRRNEGLQKSLQEDKIIKL